MVDESHADRPSELGLGLAASSTLAIAASEAAVSPELLRLIEAHKAAYAADKKAQQNWAEAEQVYSATKPPALPFTDIWARPREDNSRLDYPLEISLGRETCTERFLSNLEFRQRFAKSLFDVATPQRAKQMRAVLKALKKDGLALINATFAKDEAARRSSGLAAALEEGRRTVAAEKEAMLVLCAYRCTTLAETRLKGGYLASEHLTEILEPEHIQALLQSHRVEA